MKCFDFPLERVRRWRAEQAELEELKLEQLAAELNRIRQEKRSVENDRLRSEQEILAQKAIRAEDLRYLEDYRAFTRNKIRDTEARERKVEATILEQRRRVTEARRRAELIERLKRKALDEWETANDREQEALAAELYLAKLTRRR